MARRRGYSKMKYSEMRKLDRQRFLEAKASLSPYRDNDSHWMCGGYWAVSLFRISSFLYQRKRYFLARLCWQINHFLTGADISPHCRIAPGFAILHPASVAVAGDAGANFLIQGQAGIGVLRADRDVGAGPGMPLIGDNITLPFHTMILGPVRVGSNSTLPPGIVITQDVAEEAVLVARPNRQMPKKNSLPAFGA